MPIKLIPPRKGFSPYYYGRGTYLGVFVDRSTRCLRSSLAKRVIKKWEDEIERGVFGAESGPTFLSAALAYKKAGGDARPLAKLIAHFKEDPIQPTDLPRGTTLQQHWQNKVDTAAAELFPTHSAATRNREVYTPVSSVLKHAGHDFRIRRPKGSRGRVLTSWLWPDEAGRLFDAGRSIDPEFGALLVFLCYTGCRLSEALKLRCEDLRIGEAEAFIPTTKNGEPRRVFLPPVVVAELANHPRGLDRPQERVFRYAKSGRLYALLSDAAKQAKVTLPERSAFHIFRHTYGTWMRRFAGADTKTLVDTGTWKSFQSANRYAHSVVSEEAKLAERLPVPQKKSQ